MPVIGSTAASATTTQSGPVRDAVVARNLWMGSTSGVQTAGVTSRLRHQITIDSHGLRLWFGNWQNPESTPAPGPITIKAALEIAGTVYPVWFNGSRTVTLDGLAAIASDPLPVDVPKGTFVYSRTYVTGAGGFTPNYSTAGAGTNNGGQVSGDSVDSGTIADSYVFTLGPMNITGTVSAADFAKSVWRIGDSIAAGTGDNSGNFEISGSGPTQFGGFMSRAMNGGFGNLGICYGSDSAWKFISNGLHHRLKAAGVAKYALDNYGTNDCADGRTALQIEADLVTLWRMLRARGVTPYRCTMSPRSTSTDGWVTTTNQTSRADDAPRRAVNAWVRDGAPISSTTLAPLSIGATGSVLRMGDASHPCAGYFEVADTVESARDSGIWKANMTADGVHPNAAAHTLMATAINTSLFV
ncbi:MAG: SGNH/GDSL hydrolase family protein [Kineosporiaceae bacterium]|nr:SGNH/GDSL hydrolase family protein [Kineosporiaceae bacterium]